MRKVLAVTAGVLITMMALAACGGGGGSSKNSSGNSSGGSAEFQSLYNKRENAKIKVTYQATSDSGSKSDEVTIAQDGPNKVAYTDKNSELIVNGDTATQCSNLDSQPDCNPVPGGASAAKTMAAAYTGFFGVANTAIGAALSSKNVGNKSDQTIAGRSATCWKWSVGDIGGVSGAIANKLAGGLSYEICLDKDTGVQLKWQAGVEGKSASFEATKVEEPTGADFEPPANAATTTTSEGSTDSTDTTTDSSNTTETTTACTQITLPNGVTIPGGVTLPCLGNG